MNTKRKAMLVWSITLLVVCFFLANLRNLKTVGNTIVGQVAE